MTADALVEVRHAFKRFDGVQALDDVSLSVARGEVHALMGENGAGKSTLIKLLAGVLNADRISLEVRGSPARLQGPANAHRLGFRFIHQELNLVASLSVAENIFLGRPYPTTGLGLVSWRRLARRAREALGRLGVTHIAVQETAGRLSTGDAVLVSIARAFVEDEGDAASLARLYVMDEPTAALSGSETGLLFRVIRELRAQGSSVLYVSHRLPEIFEIADRITVMRDGRVVATQAVREVTPAALIDQMTGRALEDAYPSRPLARGASPALQLTGATNSRLREVSLTLSEGEVVGVAGLAGSGRSELLRVLAGADQLEAGSVHLGGVRVDLGSPTKAWRHALAFVPEERRTQGLVMSASVRDNAVLPHLGGLARLGFASRNRELALAKRATDDVRLKSRNLDQRVHSLSGGNQQKVVLARALAARPKVLLLDEPTRGVDVGAKRDIYMLVLGAAAGGAAVLVASSDLLELLGLCSRILVLQEGRLVHETAAAGLSQADLLALCYPNAAA